MHINQARIGTTPENTVLVSSLNSNNMPSPLMEFQPFASYDSLSSGGTRGRGKPIITWDLLQVTPEQSAALQVYCPNLDSSEVVIYSRCTQLSDEYRYYSCTMHWDQSEDIKGPRRDNLKIRFTDCIEVTPSEGSS